MGVTAFSPGVEVEALLPPFEAFGDGHRAILFPRFAFDGVSDSSSVCRTAVQCRPFRRSEQHVARGAGADSHMA
jgi:hypothetical protein